MREVERLNVKKQSLYISRKNGRMVHMNYLVTIPCEIGQKYTVGYDGILIYSLDHLCLEKCLYYYYYY